MTKASAIGLILAAVAWGQPNVAMLRGLYEQHLVEQQRDHGEFDARTAAAARDLGLFLRGHEDPAGAQAALARAVTIDERVFGAEASRTLADVADLASVSPLEEAARLFARASRSDDNAAASRAFAALGEMRASQGDREGAARYWGQALQKQEAAGGGESANAAVLLNLLGQTLAPVNAIPLLQRALAINRRLLGAQHPEVGATEQLLAAAMTSAGRAQEAVGPARDAVSILETKLGAGHPRTGTAVNTLADALRAAGKPAEAEPMYRRALAIDERVYGATHAVVLEDLRRLAEFLRERGRVSEAVALERRLVVNVAH